MPKPSIFYPNKVMNGKLKNVLSGFKADTYFIKQFK
jgi:hypothetical protein